MRLRGITVVILAMLSSAVFAQSAARAGGDGADEWLAAIAGLGVARGVVALTAWIIWYASIGNMTEIADDQRLTWMMLWGPAAALIWWTLTDVRNISLTAWMAAELGIIVALVALMVFYPPKRWHRKSQGWARTCRGASLVAIALTVARLTTGAVYLLQHPSLRLWSS